MPDPDRGTVNLSLAGDNGSVKSRYRGHRVLRGGPAVVAQARSPICSQPAPLVTSAWRYLACGRGVHQDPWGMPRSLEGDGPGRRCPGYRGHAPPRRESVQALLPQALEAARGVPWQLVTAKLGSYAAARRELALAATHRTGRYENNRAEVSPQHTRERERQMRHFKSGAQALCCLAVHAAIQNAFWVAHHRLKAMNHRFLREQTCNTWKLATCVS